MRKCPRTTRFQRKRHFSYKIWRIEDLLGFIFVYIISCMYISTNIVPIILVQTMHEKRNPHFFYLSHLVFNLVCSPPKNTH